MYQNIYVWYVLILFYQSFYENFIFFSYLYNAIPASYEAD